VGHRADLDAVAKRNISVPAGNRTPVVHPVEMYTMFTTYHIFPCFNFRMARDKWCLLCSEIDKMRRVRPDWVLTLLSWISSSLEEKSVDVVSGSLIRHLRPRLTRREKPNTERPSAPYNRHQRTSPDTESNFSVGVAMAPASLRWATQSTLYSLHLSHSLL